MDAGIQILEELVHVILQLLRWQSLGPFVGAREAVWLEVDLAPFAAASEPRLQ